MSHPKGSIHMAVRFSSSLRHTRSTSARLSKPRSFPRLESIEKRYLLSGWSLQTLASFDGTDGKGPIGQLAVDSSGNTYGATEEGGAFNTGTVFEIAGGSNQITTLASLGGASGAGVYPATGVVLDSQGNLYGTTQEGGANDTGTIFELANGSNTITTLASIGPNQEIGLQSGLTIDASGNLYGTTDRSVFEIAKGSTALTTLATFNTPNGADSDSPLLLDKGGNLYGTTEHGGSGDFGTIFEIARGSDTITVLASFNGSNGAYPQGALVLDPSGNLYGATGAAGENAAGVFELPKGSNQIVKFASGVYLQGGLTIDPAGNIYGEEQTSYEGVFELAKGTSGISQVAEFNQIGGVLPDGPLTLSPSGNLIGTTFEGGAANGVEGAGTVFELSPNTAVTVKLTNGTNPSAANQQLTYTATVSGGITDGQTVLLQDASNNDAYIAAGVLVDGTATVTVLPNTLSAGTHDLIVTYGGDLTHAASFSAPLAQVVTTGGSPAASAQGGSSPAVDPTITSGYSLSDVGNLGPYISDTYVSGVTLDSNGDIFGVSDSPAPQGSVYEIASGSNTVTTLVTFSEAEPVGYNPHTGVTVDAEGNIYGTTDSGGAHNEGTIFEIARGSTAATVLASFSSVVGGSPEQSLTIDASGNLYGTTEATVFELPKGSSALTVRGTFSYKDGLVPSSPLLLDAAGNIYGTAAEGGAFGDGAIFEVAKGSNTLTDLVSFNGTDGAYPGGTIAMDAEGNLYGASGGIYELVKGSGTITVLESGAPGGTPSGVVMDAAGNLYGTSNGDSVVEYSRVFHTFTILESFSAADENLVAGVTRDAAGDIYGVSIGGGVDNEASVFKLTPNTTVALATGSNPAAQNQQLTYTATITSGVEDGETVLLEDASDNDAYIAAGVVVNGSATLTILPDTLSVGTHDLIVVYGGDGTHANSISPPLAQIITDSTARPGHRP